jgi:hypothetical protein
MAEEELFRAVKRLLLAATTHQLQPSQLSEALNGVLAATATHGALAATIQPLLVEVLRAAHAHLGKVPASGGAAAAQAALTTLVTAAVPGLTAAQLAPVPLPLSPPLPASFTPSPADAGDLALNRDLRPTCDAAAARRLTAYLERTARATVAPVQHFHFIEAARKDLMKLLDKHANAASTEVFG